MILLFLLGIGCFSFVLTGLIRRYALSREMMDVPNARSSHSIPTPRGGGMAIVISFLIALPVLHFFDLIALNKLLSFLIAGVIDRHDFDVLHKQLDRKWHGGSGSLWHQ